MHNRFEPPEEETTPPEGASYPWNEQEPAPRDPDLRSASRSAAPIRKPDLQKEAGHRELHELHPRPGPAVRLPQANSLALASRGP